MNDTRIYIIVPTSAMRWELLKRDDVIISANPANADEDVVINNARRSLDGALSIVKVYPQNLSAVVSVLNKYIVVFKFLQTFL